MDVLDLVKADHQRIFFLFHELITEENDQARFETIGEVRHELEIHFQLEETIFYPALSSFEELRHTLKTFKSEHLEMRAMLRDLSQKRDFTIDFQNLLLELKNRFENHVAEVEDEPFVLARRELTDHDREKLGRYFLNAKKDLEEKVA